MTIKRTLVTTLAFYEGEIETVEQFKRLGLAKSFKQSVLKVLREAVEKAKKKG